jgi:transposase InsO family protein
VANLLVGAIQGGGIAMTAPLTPEQRVSIYDRHRQGESLGSIAQDLGVHYETARKWWRVGRLQGRRRLADRPRKPLEVLRNVPPAVVERLRALRRQHRESWGVPYLRQQLLRDRELTPAQRARVPSLSTLYRYVRAQEAQEPRRPLRNQIPSTPLIAQTEYPHQLWQMDLKEKCRVCGLGQQVSVATVRDVYSSLTVGAEVFQLTRRNATLSGGDMQAACRECFARFGLPDILRTDQGSCFVGTMPQSGFPSHFTLWLVGLGIAHETIRKGEVTQNGCVERFNRTFNGLVLRDGPFATLEELQDLADETRDFLNHRYPSRAGSCQGQPPLTAHPHAARPRRRFCADREAQLFDRRRVDQYLARFCWQRRADQVGTVSLGSQPYHLGREHRGRVFDVTFDPRDRHFVFETPDEAVTVRRPAQGLEPSDILTRSTSAIRPLRCHDKTRPI